jgi:peroxiredoxin
VVIGLNNEDDKEKPSKFAKEKGLKYPILRDMAKTFTAYGVMSLPTNFFVDRKGNVQSRSLGFADGMEADFVKTIEALLAEK